jgi:hypothetical protein
MWGLNPITIVAGNVHKSAGDWVTQHAIFFAAGVEDHADIAGVQTLASAQLPTPRRRPMADCCEIRRSFFLRLRETSTQSRYTPEKTVDDFRRSGLIGHYAKLP